MLTAPTTHSTPIGKSTMPTAICTHLGSDGSSGSGTGSKCRLTCNSAAARQRVMRAAGAQWQRRACGAHALPYHGPLQLHVMRRTALRKHCTTWITRRRCMVPRPKSSARSRGTGCRSRSALVVGEGDKRCQQPTQSAPLSPLRRLAAPRLLPTECRA